MEAIKIEKDDLKSQMKSEKVIDSRVMRGKRKEMESVEKSKFQNLKTE